MPDTRADALLTQGDKLFSKRGQLMSLWQEVSEQFYPERADFTVRRNAGEDFANHLMTSDPIKARRDLGNSFSAMLRPPGQEWFEISTARPDRVDNAGKRWLEWASGVQRRAMEARASQFKRATKEGDHDFAAFGQCVISVEMNRAMDDLLYRCWHLRDMAWCEGMDGTIDQMHRKWKPEARMLIALFGEKVGDKVRQAYEKDAYCEIDVRHVVIKADQYEGQRKYRTPWVSVYYDAENREVIEETGVWNPIYVIPRWQTVSGSQYAYSPATVAALPDARLIQAMTRVLLEAGEKYTNPPMLAVQEAIRSDIAIYAGGITWVDAEYDERLGEVLRPISQDKSGIPIGMDMRQDVREMIADAFYLNKLGLPPVETKGDMTAFEVGQRVQEYIRAALPLFEPLETDYNGALCEATFDVLMRNGAFGSTDDLPQSLSGAEVRFQFKSPLRAAEDQKVGAKFMEARALLAEAVAIDPGLAVHVDATKAFREAFGAVAPADWLRDEDEAAEMQQANEQAMQMQQAMEMARQGGEAVEQVGKGGQALRQMEEAA